MVLAYWQRPEPGGPPPVVFLHGLLRNRDCFAPLFPALLGRRGIYSLDHAGHGESTRLPSYRVVDHLPGLIAFLDHELRGKPVVLYGHSMGAMHAAAIAAARPDLVQATILEDPPFHTMGARLAGSPLRDYFHAIQPHAGAGLTWQQLAAVRVGGQTLGELRDASQLRFMARCFGAVDPAVLDAVLAGHWLDGYDVEAVWRRLQRPTLLLQADPAAGGMLTDEDAAAFARAALDTSLIRLPGVGHQAHWQDAPAVTRHLLAFLGCLD